MIIPVASKSSNPYYAIQINERPYDDWPDACTHLLESGSLANDPHNIEIEEKDFELDIYIEGTIFTYKVNGQTVVQFDIAEYDADFGTKLTKLLQNVDTLGYGAVRHMTFTIKNASVECYQTKFGDNDRKYETTVVPGKVNADLKSPKS